MTDKLATVPKPDVIDVAADCWEITDRSDISPSGYKIVKVPVPTDLAALTPLQQAIILQSTKSWSGQSIPFLLYVLQRCAALGLDPASGDIYAVDGRLSTSDDAKIRAMRRSGKVDWVRLSDLTKDKHPISGKDDFFIEASIKHKDESEPQRYTAWLSEWNNPKNANWAARPIEALGRKALARLSHRMFPLGEDETEIGGDPTPNLGQELSSRLTPPTAVNPYTQATGLVGGPSNG